MTTERNTIFEALASEEIGDALDEASPTKMREEGDDYLAFLVESYQDIMTRIVAELEEENEPE
jgi:hypothetical protein